MGDKIFSSQVHVNYKKHKAYINIDLISVIDFLSSAAVRHLSKIRNKHLNTDKK